MDLDKKVKIRGHDLSVTAAEKFKGEAPDIHITGSAIDFASQPEKIQELMKLLGISDDITIEVKTSTSSIIVE